jgi:hypothetical protein|tara:strand:- start:228 stop:755 length:528 start_codon:yes stop_codon:yes gene_type:complete
MGQKLTEKAALEQQVGSGDLLMVVDVNDTQGSPEGTSKKMDFKYLMQTDKFSLDNTEIQALHTTPKTLVGALSGYMVTPLSVTMLCTYAASKETSSNNLYFGYDASTDLSYWFQQRDVMHDKISDMTYIGSAFVPTAGAYTTSILNKPLMMWSNAAFNGGWSMDVYVTYAYTKIL